MNIQKLSALTLAVFFSLSSLLAADYEKVSDKKLFNGEVLSEYKLPNGLKVLFLPRHEAKLLTFQTWFDIGSLDEKMDNKLKKTGLAHLFEHMMFRGTDKYPDGKFDEITSRIGSDKQNATTYFYRTNYYESIPSSQLKKLIELESDRMANLKLDSTLLEKEKGAVVGELRRALDNPGRIAWDELNRTVFQVSPFRYTVIGTEEEIKGFSLEEAQYFYKTFYAPNNATIIVVGDTEESELLPLVVKFYGDMKAQEIPRYKLPEEPTQKKERRAEKTHPQATSDILLVGYRIPSVNSPKIVPLSLLSTHLSTGMESRLRKSLVDTGIAVSAGCGVSNVPDYLEFTVSLSEKHKAEEALQIIDREIQLLKNQVISKDSFERALNQELLSLYGMIQDNSSMANMLGDYLMVSGNYLRGFEIIEEFKKIKPQDLKNTAKEFLNKESRSVVIVRPQPKTTSKG
ncbi:MAG: insulinase family protein [Deltaproteobacteria bacterium]|nr:insulinase family protein [Deltaproteobacteria bacterium]